MSDFFQQFMPARVFRATQPVRNILAKGILARGSWANGIFATAAASVAVLGMASCGSNLRPTTTPIVGTGPASQPQELAFVISTPSPTAQGIGTVIDYSGDTVMATAPIGPGPSLFTMNTGTEAWTLNGDGTVSNIPVNTTLQNKNVFLTTLNPIPTTGQFAGQDPIVALFDGSVGLFALDDNLNELDVLNGSPAAAFKLVIPVDTTPVTMIGVAASTRYYSVSQMIPYGTACNTSPSTVGVTGMADGIETTTYTVSSHIPVGVCPVYAVGTPDTRRVYVLNRGSDTISVINSQNNALDSTCPPPTGCLNQNGQTYFGHPTLPLSTAAVTNTGITPPNGTSGMPATAGPVYAEYNAATEQLVVSDYDGGTISIIDVSLDEYGNDSATFGTTYTVKVGNNPAAVTVLADGSRAYVANQADSTVSIVTLASHTIENTLAVTGHPRTVVSTQNSLFGKVYVVSPDSDVISIIRTDQDILSTTVLVQGNAIDVRTTSADGIAGNLNLVSRLPGAGQPCFLPLAELPAASITTASCKYQSTSQLTP
jgi:DNA-binding beta-propeller fold protein YncE